MTVDSFLERIFDEANSDLEVVNKLISAFKLLSNVSTKDQLKFGVDVAQRLYSTPNTYSLIANNEKLNAEINRVAELYNNLDRQHKTVKEPPEIQSITDITNKLKEMRDNFDKVMKGTWDISNFENVMHQLEEWGNKRMFNSYNRDIDEFKKTFTEVNNLVQSHKGANNLLNTINSNTKGAFDSSSLSEKAQNETGFNSVNLEIYSESEIEAEKQKIVNASREAAQKAVEEFNSKISKIKEVVKEVVNAVITSIKLMQKYITTGFQHMASIFNMFTSTVQRLIKLFGNLANRVGSFNKNTNILKGTYTELYSAIRLVTGAFNKMFNNQFIKEGEKLLSSIQTLNIVIGKEATEATIEWAKELENVFGLSAAGLIQSLREVSAVMKGLGMEAKDVAVASKSLGMMANGLSAVIGYDYDTVMNKITSGMRGMTQSIDDLGLSVREAQMDAFLNDLKAQGGEYANIETSFSKLNEQQRVYVRYAALVDQYMKAYSWEDYKNSLDSISGRLNILKQRVASLKSVIGAFAIQLFDRIVKPLTYIVYLAELAIRKIASIFNINLDLNADLNGNKDVIKDNKDLADSIDEVSEASDKAKGSLDELDHVSNLSSSSENKGNNSTFDYSSLIGFGDKYLDELNNKLNEWGKNYLEECRQALIDWLNARKNDITKWFKDLTGRDINWDIIADRLRNIWNNIKKIADNVRNTFKNVFDIVAGLGLSFLDDIEFTNILDKLFTLIERFTALTALITDKVQPVLQKFYDDNIKPLAEALGIELDGALDKAISKVEEWIELWSDHYDEKGIKIVTKEQQDALDKVYDTLKTIFDVIKKIVIVTKALFTGNISPDDAEFINGGNAVYDEKGIKTNNINNADETNRNLKAMVDNAKSVNSIFRTTGEIFEQLLTDLYAWLTMPNSEGITGFERIGEIVEKIATFIKENKDAIINILKEIAKTEFTYITSALNAALGIAEAIVKYEEPITNILKALQSIMEFVGNNPEFSLKVLIGMKVAGMAVKGILTALFWKRILGIGSKGALATACSGIGTAITGAINKIKWGAVIKELDGLVASEVAATSSFGLTGAAAGVAATGIVAGTIGTVIAEIKKGIPQVKSIWDDAWIDMTGGLAEATDEAGNKVKITTTNAKQWAYDMRSALEQVYGKDIPTDGYEIALNKIISELRSTGYYTEQELEKIRQNIEKQYENIGSINWFDDIAYKTENSEKVISGLVDELNNKTTELKNTTATNTTSVTNSVTNMTNRITRSCSSAMSSLSRLMNSILRLNSTNVNVHLATGSNYAGSRYKYNPKVRTLGMRANGGTVSSGSLFMANENGNTELVGNFGGYTGVANQDMIITAMQNAMTNAMKNAGANNGAVNNYNFDICKSGMFVGDESAVRKLANMINNTNVSNRSNIANVGFSM